MTGKGSLAAPPEERGPSATAPRLPTAPHEPDVRRSRRARRLRRLFMSLLFVFCLLGLLGVFGVKSRTVSATGGGYRLEVTYAQVSRGGLATPWSFEVHKDGGFDGPVEIATSSSYLDLFDENGLDPDPDSSTATPEEIIWEFAPPDGETLSVTFDARLEPAVQWGRRGYVSVLEDGEPVVTARYKTWVLP